MGQSRGSRLTFAHYQRVFATPASLGILLNTLKVGLIVTLVSLAAGYPVAYLLTRMRSRAFSIVTVFILIPLFTAFLIRTYAWIVILGRQGIVNNALIWLGLISEPLPLLNTTFAVVVEYHVFIPWRTSPCSPPSCHRSRLGLRADTRRQAGTGSQRVYFPMSLPGVFPAS